MNMKSAIEVLNKISQGCKDDTTPYGNTDKIPSTVIDTYGELMPESVSLIIKRLNINKNDIFFDLGCGTGRICFQIYLEKDIKCVGIEYVQKRYDLAIKYLLNLKKQYKNTRKVKIIKNDFFNEDFSQGTIFYMCNTCLPEEVIKKLLKKLRTCPKLRYVFVMKELPQNEIHRFLRLKETLDTPTSWSTTTNTHIYERI